MKYEESDLKNQDKLSLDGFVSYLNDPEHYLIDPNIASNIYQDMNHPLSSYFINSSHNT